MPASDLTEFQAQVLGYVDSQGPVSVADVASSLMVTASSARSRLDTLERRGLLAVQVTGHHRGRGRAYVTTDKGSEAVAAVFGADDEGSDEPIPVRIYAHVDGTFNRFHEDLRGRTERGLTRDDLRPEEQAVVDAARAAGGTATIDHITVSPARRLGVVEEWWK